MKKEKLTNSYLWGVLKTKAFTLIELLAIIVILAIIAVITVPIILNVIDNAKRGSVIDSAYGYKDSINKYYITKLSEDPNFKLDGTYLVSELKGIGLTVSGKEPTDDSWVVIKDNGVYDFSLKFDDYVANYDVDTNEVSAIKNGTIELTPEAQAEQDRINNIKQIITAYIEEAKTKNSSLDSETVKSVSEMVDVVIENGPVEGWVHFDIIDDEVVIKDYSLKVDNYVADYSEDITVTKDGTLRDIPVLRVVVRTIDGVGYYNTEWIGANPVYYNPVTGAKCSNYHEDNSKNGYNGLTTNGSEDNTTNNNGCLKWYAYSEQNGQVNLLLDHNTTEKVVWVTRTDYDKPYDNENGARSLGITYPGNVIAEKNEYGFYGNWNKGPITLLHQLKTDTEGWAGIPNRTDSYTASNNYSSGTVIDIYTINYSQYKARLIAAQEITNIVNNTSWSEKTARSGFVINSDFQWLLSNLSKCEPGEYYEPCGYWTVSSSPRDYFNHSTNVWVVDIDGNITTNASGGNKYYSYQFHGSNHGLRPVITVPKSSIFES